MRKKYVGFLKTSSRLVKIAAWIFLLFGILQGIATIFGLGQNAPRFMGVVYFFLYGFVFFFTYLVAAMADLLLSMWQFLKKERF